MDRNPINGRLFYASTSTDGGDSAGRPRLLPNYSSRAVQEALEHLASIDLHELCGEAKLERCRATRDLRSCGRYVQYVLNSCGHASLCSECSQRCDLCPICRIPIPKNSNRLRLRLFYECIEAGLISKQCDERFQEGEEGDSQLTADVQRLYSLFDVAMENNLVSLICHYVTDVCMDESAVSSDPVIAFLLDEVVIKDWCKRTFANVISELQEIYNLEAEDVKDRLDLLPKFSFRLGAILNVLEVLVSSIRDSLSAQLHDLQLLEENALKTKQHADIMAWCIRHEFLKNVKARYTDVTSWCSVVGERKSAAIRRSWPDVVNQDAEPSTPTGSLFIDDALENLDIGHVRDDVEEPELLSLHKDKRLLFRSKIEGVAGCYPFESLRTAVDLLFLHGSSDLVVAKQAIFLYYLFDRHWTRPDEAWRHIVDDFAATFGITRHSLLESLTFYLLDDNTDEALQEACNLLPEISGPSTHPKIAQVLLEREAPETALMVLRWSGQDGSQLISLNEAVTAVRIRVACGLLTEAFMYQRMLCNKFRESKLEFGVPRDASDGLKGYRRPWEDWVEILVTEICCLCIKSNLVDRMIELPWNSEEEKYIHKCLFDYADHDPSTTTGSLLVVFYLQRYRYVEAYQTDLKLKILEEDFLSKNTVKESVLSRIRSASQWRAGLVARSIDLLPQVQQQVVRAGKLLPGILDSFGEEPDVSAKSDIPLVQQPMSNSLVLPKSGDSSVIYTDHATPLGPSVLETPINSGISIYHPRFALENHGCPSVLLANAERGLRPQESMSKNFGYDGASTSGSSHVKHVNGTPSRETTRTSSQVLPDSNLHQYQFDKFSPEMQQNGFTKKYQSSPAYSPSTLANAVAPSGSNLGFPNDSAHIPWSRHPGEKVHSHGNDRDYKMTSGDDPMSIGWSGGEEQIAIDEKNVNGAFRWRSDETSEDEEEPNLERAVGEASHTTPRRRIRKSRFARR
ncbi:hypothetical protein K2173_002865 [Erythroxylum novogranatense]|uniref:ELYS-like domain-containing protein n=1 Tax=Erythroxylum novogranatense TaxID=1862640 RepID=A0AAV8SQY7_9ROSI|nr:hypothetical protein K2173_002865 [Erythroxylum novogranatense]